MPPGTECDHYGRLLHIPCATLSIRFATESSLHRTVLVLCTVQTHGSGAILGLVSRLQLPLTHEDMALRRARRPRCRTLAFPSSHLFLPLLLSAMHSPTTPRARSLSSSKFFVNPWRPWRIPQDWTSIRRSLCGLLNKVAPANVDRIADHFAALAINLGRSGNAAHVESAGQMLVHRCTVDPLRIGLYAKLIQRAADGLEGESLRWRSVDRTISTIRPLLSLQL